MVWGERVGSGDERMGSEGERVGSGVRGWGLG